MRPLSALVWLSFGNNETIAIRGYRSVRNYVNLKKKKPRQRARRGSSRTSPFARTSLDKAGNDTIEEHRKSLGEGKNGERR
jgi:hypothetical protein